MRARNAFTASCFLLGVGAITLSPTAIAQTVSFTREVFIPSEDPINTSRFARAIAIEDINGDGIFDIFCGLSQEGFTVVRGGLPGTTPFMPFSSASEAEDNPGEGGTWLAGETHNVVSIAVGQFFDGANTGTFDVLLASTGTATFVPGQGFVNEQDGYIDFFRGVILTGGAIEFFPFDCLPVGCLGQDSVGFEWSTLRDMQVGDVTGDGIPDLISLHSPMLPSGSVATVRVWRGDLPTDPNEPNDLSYTLIQQLSFGNQCESAGNSVRDPLHLLLADMNQDSELDLLAGVGNSLPEVQGPITDQLVYWPNQPAPVPTPFSTSGPAHFDTSPNGTRANIGGTSGITYGDFNGDGLLEVAVCEQFTNQIHISSLSFGGASSNTCLPWSGAGDFDLGAVIGDFHDGSGYFLATQLAAGDLDLDGIDDLVVVGKINSDAEIYVLLNRGSPDFEVVPLDVVLGGTWYDDVVVRDINGDQRPDVIVSGRDNPINVFYNTTVHFADLNSDGCVDGADLAQLLAMWGNPGTADFNGDGIVNGADLATLLANWGVGCIGDPGEPELPLMAMQGQGNVDGFDFIQEEPAPQSTINAPWVISYFGFNSIQSYVAWIDLLDEETLSAHILELLELILNENE